MEKPPPGRDELRQDDRDEIVRTLGVDPLDVVQQRFHERPKWRLQHEKPHALAPSLPVPMKLVGGHWIDVHVQRPHIGRQCLRVLDCLYDGPMDAADGDKHRIVPPCRLIRPILQRQLSVDQVIMQARDTEEKNLVELRDQLIVGTARCRMIQLPAPLPGRPFYLNVEGGRLYISVHDVFHLETEREFKRQIRSAHPDRNHHRWATSRTRNLLKARERWEGQEARRYARFGLDPPKRMPQGYPSVGSGSSATPLPLPTPVERPKPSRLTFGHARTSPTMACQDHHDFTGVIRTCPEHWFKPSFTPTCHSPPGTWRAADRGPLC